MKAQQGLGPMLTVLTTENTLSGPINAEYRVMSPISLVPEQDLHFVLCDFGRFGQSYIETDPMKQMLRASSAISCGVSMINPCEFWR
jgi:hypothetical protein